MTLCSRRISRGAHWPNRRRFINAERACLWYKSKSIAVRNWHVFIATWLVFARMELNAGRVLFLFSRFCFVLLFGDVHWKACARTLLRLHIRKHSMINKHDRENYVNRNNGKWHVCHNYLLLHLHFADTHTPTHAFLCWARSTSSVLSLRQHAIAARMILSLRCSAQKFILDAVKRFHSHLLLQLFAVELFFAVTAHERAGKTKNIHPQRNSNERENRRKMEA